MDNNSTVWEWRGKDELSKTIEGIRNKMLGLEKETEEMEGAWSGAMKSNVKSVDYLKHSLENFIKLRDNAFDEKDIRRFNDEIKNTQREIDRLQTISNNRDLTPMARPGWKQRFTAGFSEVGAGFQQIPGVGPMGAALANPYVMGGAAIAAGGKFTWDSYKYSLDVDQQMAKINATAKLSKAELEKVEAQLFDMAIEAKVAFDTVPDGFETVLSSNGDVNESLEITKNALKAAKTNASDFAVVGEGVAKTLAIIGDQGYDAGKVLDIFQAGKDFGSGNFEDFARYLPRLTSLASGLGLKFEEVAGAYSFMTKQFTNEDSAMFLSNAFQALGKTDRQKALKSQLGVDVFDETGKMREFSTIMKDINIAMQGMTDEQRISKLDKIGFDMQASTAILAMSAGYKDLAVGINMANNSAGLLDETWKKTKTDADALTDLANNWSNFKNEVGEGAQPRITQGINAINDAAFGSSNQTRMKGAISLLKTYGETWLDFAKYTTPQGWALMGISEAIDKVNQSFSNTTSMDNWVDRLKRHKSGLQGLLDRDPMQFKAVVKLEDEQVKEYVRQYEKNPLRIQTMFNMDSASSTVYLKKIKELYGLAEPEGKDKVVKTDNKIKNKNTDTDKQAGNSKEVDSVVAGGRQVKYLTINIENMVGEFNQVIQGGKIQETDKREMKQTALEAFMEVVNDGETQIGN